VRNLTKLNTAVVVWEPPKVETTVEFRVDWSYVWSSDILLIASGNKAIYLPNKHQHLVYYCEVNGMNYPVQSVRNLTKLNTAVVVWEPPKVETTVEFRVDWSYVWIVCLIGIVVLEPKLGFTIAVLILLSNIHTTQALTLERTMRTTEILNIALVLVGPLNWAFWSSWLVVCIVAYKFSRNDYLTRSSMIMLMYPMYKYRPLEYVVGYTMLLIAIHVFDSWFRDMEFRLNDHFNDFRGGDSTEQIDVLVEMEKALDAIFKRLTMAGTVFKSVTPRIVQPIRYMKTMFAQAMYHEVRPRKYPRVLDRRKRNVRNMRSVIFYDEEFEIIHRALARMTEWEIKSIYDRAETVAAREPFDLFWMREVVSARTLKGVDACLQMDYF